MKKLVCLTLFVLFATLLVSCARATHDQEDGTPSPGVNNRNITVEEHSIGKTIPDLSEYCGAYQSQEMEPGTHTVDCELPLLPRIQIDFGWIAKDTTTLDSNWSAMTWELYIDGHQINLDEFEQSSESGPSITGHTNSPNRGWIIDLVNPSPGKHTLRLLWRSDVPIDDGFDIYAPGTYENIVNFTVLEK